MSLPPSLSLSVTTEVFNTGGEMPLLTCMCILEVGSAARIISLNNFLLRGKHSAVLLLLITKPFLGLPSHHPPALPTLSLLRIPFLICHLNESCNYKGKNATGSCFVFLPTA